MLLCRWRVKPRGIDRNMKSAKTIRLFGGSALVTALLIATVPLPAHAEFSYEEKTDKMSDQKYIVGKTTIRTSGITYEIEVQCETSGRNKGELLFYIATFEGNEPKRIVTDVRGNRELIFRVDKHPSFTQYSLVPEYFNQIKVRFFDPERKELVLNSSVLLIQGIIGREIIEIGTKFSEEFREICFKPDREAAERRREAVEAQRRAQESARRIQQQKEEEEARERERERERRRLLEQRAAQEAEVNRERSLLTRLLKSCLDAGNTQSRCICMVRMGRSVISVEFASPPSAAIDEFDLARIFNVIGGRNAEYHRRDFDWELKHKNKETTQRIVSLLAKMKNECSNTN